MTSTTLHIALLRKTRDRQTCVLPEVTASIKASGSLVRKSLSELAHAGSVSVAGEEVQVTPEQRLMLAEAAIENGADPEKIARELRWQEFETFINRVLVREGFTTTSHFVFKSLGHRYEIDVIGAREPMVLCIDCKHWHHGWAPGKIKAAAANQATRVLGLSKVVECHGRRLPLGQWHSIRLLPVVVTLADTSSKLVDGVPIVSALRFGTFLSEVTPYVSGLRFLDASYEKLG